ncbi:MAG: hypothetical protein E7608_01120 [Ruminococcaceae bacterium]|nr:hypothetical protein [Oscillospiraceae bacterium]
MFELTNEQRKCFAIPPVQSTWKRVEVKAGPYDDHVTFAYLDGRKIVKVIQISENAGKWLYNEYGVDQMLSEDGLKILPKTEKGKAQNFTAPNLTKKTPVGMGLHFRCGYIDIYNNTTDQCYYRVNYEDLKVYNLSEFCDWVKDWCKNTGEKELLEIEEFSKRRRIHQKFREGDFFRYRIKRNLYGYGRILVDYEKMRKEGVPFWNVFMGKPLCVAVYHIATENADMPVEKLAHLKMLPSQMIMDNIFYYGECEIIGNMPIMPDEENYTIHYGGSVDARTPNLVCYQCGKTYVALQDEKLLYDNFRKQSISWDLDVKLPILLECIKNDSNEPYWELIRRWRANEDLRNPKFKEELKNIKEQMGVK